MSNYTYILKCADDMLYCGWTNNLEKRLAAHNAGTAAKYTRTRRPVALVYYEEFETNQNNNGLSDDIIKSFPVSKIKNVKKLSEDKKKCSICLEKFKNNDNTMIIPCTHLFHPNCIQKWMKIKNICPICKYKIY